MKHLNFFVITLFASSLKAQQPTSDTTNVARKILTYAKSKLGAPYGWGGRETKKNPNLDCMGLCFRAYASTFGDKWYKYSVIPSELIKSGKLGDVVLKGNPVNEASIEAMKPGDVVYILINFNFSTKSAETNNKAVAVINDQKYWVFHMGIYSRDGKMIHASPWDSKVVEESIAERFTGYYIMTTRRK